MTNDVKKKHEGRLPDKGGSSQNSYVEEAASTGAPQAPDIQQPGPAGDFGNDSTNTSADKSESSALPSKHSGGRTPGDQPELSHQTDDGSAKHPDEAAEPSNTYSGN
jgi:hypothetical protein